METPYLTHITNEEFLHVYEPSEDSFLLLDALEKELDELKLKRPSICCEVGSGSGINITSLSKNINNCLFLSTDINSNACDITLKTAKFNGTNVEAFNMDLLSCFRNNIFDVIFFNPPYVVTETEEVNSSDISHAWAGGENGRVIIDRFLSKLNDYLTKTGICYLVVIKENKPHEIEANMSKLGFQTNIVIERRIRGEFLSVMKFFRKM